MGRVKSNLRYLPKVDRSTPYGTLPSCFSVGVDVLTWKRCSNIDLVKSGLISLSTLCTRVVAARHHSTSDCIRISSSYNLTRQINSILQRRSQNYDNSQSHLANRPRCPLFFFLCPRIPIAEYSVRPIRCSKAMLCCISSR